MNDDDFDFGSPPDVSSELAELTTKYNDLLVLVDTLQTNLRTATTIIQKYEPECEFFNTPSYKWVTNWKNN